MIPTIETREEVMFFDTDIGGVVHNIAYLRFVETARTRLAEVMGLPLKEMAATQCFPVVTRTEIDYRRPATLGDRLQVTGRLEKFNRARFWCSFTIQREETPLVSLISCRQALALVQLPAGKPLRLPRDWRARYAEAYVAGGSPAPAGEG